MGALYLIWYLAIGALTNHYIINPQVNEIVDNEKSDDDKDAISIISSVAWIVAWPIFILVGLINVILNDFFDI